MGHPLLVELVEDVVEQQDGGARHLGFHELELGKLQGDQKGLLLPLAAEFFDGMALDLHAEVVFVHPLRGELQQAVFVEMAAEQFFEGGLAQLAFVYQRHRFFPS